MDLKHEIVKMTDQFDLPPVAAPQIEKLAKAYALSILPEEEHFDFPGGIEKDGDLYARQIGRNEIITEAKNNINKE